MGAAPERRHASPRCGVEARFSVHGSDAARQVGLGALEGSFKEGVEVLRSTAWVLGGEVALIAGLSGGACWGREQGT